MTTIFCVYTVCLPPLPAAAAAPEKREYAIRSVSVLLITLALTAIHQIVTAATPRVIYVSTAVESTQAVVSKSGAPTIDVDAPLSVSPALASMAAAGLLSPRGSVSAAGPRGSIVNASALQHRDSVAKLLDDSDRAADQQKDEQKRKSIAAEAMGESKSEHTFEGHLDTPIMRTLSFLIRLKANPHVKFAEVRELIDVLSSSGALDAPILTSAASEPGTHHPPRMASITSTEQKDTTAGGSGGSGSGSGKTGSGGSGHGSSGSGDSDRPHHHRNSSTPTGGLHGSGVHQPRVSSAVTQHHGMIREWLADEVAHHEMEKNKRTTMTRTDAQIVKDLLRASHSTRASQVNLFGTNLHMLKLLPAQPELAKELTQRMENLDDWNVGMSFVLVGVT